MPHTPSPPKYSSSLISGTSVLDDIYGQEKAKRALIIAAAGRHNVLLSDTPGAGKTMLARTLTTLLPILSADEQIAVTKLHSLAGEAIDSIVSRHDRFTHLTIQQAE